jgi:hypothetical protein
MEKILKLVIAFALTCCACFAHEAALELPTEELPLFEKIKKAEVDYTDKPYFLMHEQMTFRPKKGIVKDYTLSAGYHGSLAGVCSGSNYNTKHNIDWTVGRVTGNFKDEHTSFLLHTRLVPVEEIGFWHGLIADAYIANTRIPHHRIVAGYTFTPTGVEGGQSIFTLPFTARSQISRTFGGVRGLGVRTIGTYPLVNYDVMVGSSDRFWHSFFPGAEFTGWVNFTPLGKTDGKWGKLTVGTGVNTGRNDFTYTVGDAYVSYNYKKLTLNWEGAIADGYNGVVGSQNKAGGFYTTAMYNLTPKVQLLARYDRFDPNRDVANNMRTEITAGVNYFVKGQGLRFILNCVYCKNENAVDSSRIMLGTQILI